MQHNNYYKYFKFCAQVHYYSTGFGSSQSCYTYAYIRVLVFDIMVTVSGCAGKLKKVNFILLENEWLLHTSFILQIPLMQIACSEEENFNLKFLRSRILKDNLIFTNIFIFFETGGWQQKWCTHLVKGNFCSDIPQQTSDQNLSLFPIDVSLQELSNNCFSVIKTTEPCCHNLEI